MIDPSRRRLLVYGGGFITLAAVGGDWLVRSHARPAPPMAALVDELPQPSAAFIRVSAALTGLPQPDPHLGQRLYAALHQDHPALDQAIEELERRLLGRPHGPPSFADAPAVADVYKQLLSGWYLGVVGPKLAPRCIGFETTVSYSVVANWVSPPSYCAGQPFFWVDKPTQATA